MLAFNLPAGTWLLLAVLRIEPSATDTLYLRLRDTTGGVDVVSEARYVLPTAQAVALNAVVTLAAPAAVEVQAKQLDDCAIQSNGSSFVAVRMG